jgi:hypothetical protein
MIEADAVLKLAEDTTFQPLSDGRQTVILSLDSGHIFTCNATTTAFLKALDGRRTFAQVLDVLQADFDVAREKLAGDMSVMAERMLTEGLVRRGGAPR